MRTKLKARWIITSGTLAFTILGIIVKTMAQTVPPPVISISQTATNQFLVTVTNGVSYANYTLYNRLLLGDPAFPWTLLSNAVPGVTNFTVNMGPDIVENFFLMAGGTSYTNGVPNWELANPNNPGLGILTITIISPTNGATLQ